MPATNVIPIVHPARRLTKRARAARRADLGKSTTRFFFASGHGVVPLAQQGTSTGSVLLIEGARATADHYRTLAAQAEKAVMQARMLGLAAKWDKRAEALDARRRAAQLPGGPL